MSVALSESESQRLDGGSSGTSNINACFYRPVDGGTPASPPLVTEGPCSVYGSGGATGTSSFEAFRGDVGTLSVQGAPAGPLQLQAVSGSLSPCMGYAAGQTGRLFAPGGTLDLSASGGVDFPAFQTRLAAPPALSLQDPGPVRRGQPVRLRWNATNSGTFSLYLLTSSATGSFRSISCQVPDTGEYTLPGALTQHLLSSEASLSYVSGSFLREVRLEPASPLVLQSITASRSVSRDIQYSP
jgi:hypothetical protein